MKHLTEEMIQEISNVFGIQPVAESLPVKDGRVIKGQFIWWHHEEGPKEVASDSGTHWGNIKMFPNIYSVKKPEFTTIIKAVYHD